MRILKYYSLFRQQLDKLWCVILLRAYIKHAVTFIQQTSIVTLQIWLLIHAQAPTKAQAWKVIHYFCWWCLSVRTYVCNVRTYEQNILNLKRHFSFDHWSQAMLGLVSYWMGGQQGNTSSSPAGCRWTTFQANVLVGAWAWIIVRLQSCLNFFFFMSVMRRHSLRLNTMDLLVIQYNKRAAMKRYENHVMMRWWYNSASSLVHKYFRDVFD